MEGGVSIFDRIIESKAMELVMTLLMVFGVLLAFGGTCVSGARLRVVTGEQIATCVSLCPGGITKFTGDDECVCKSGIVTKVVQR